MPLPALGLVQPIDEEEIYRQFVGSQTEAVDGRGV